jgi:uncharacterized protein YycO
MRGDILFVRGGPGLSDRLICWKTRGPFVHAAVDLGDGTVIESHWRTGVRVNPVNYAGSIAYSLPTTTPKIEAGIAWLHSHVGDPYGWSDILDNIITLFLPRSLIVSQQHGFDCSDLVARYIDVAGGLELGSLLDAPSLISPNDLARSAGLL